MVPTLLVGDMFYLNRSIYRDHTPRRGDIVAYFHELEPSRSYVKRVIGLPNETIRIENKRVFIDGKALEEAYVMFADSTIHPADSDPRDNFGPYRLGHDKYFLLGDNRDNSNDSRYSGPVSRAAILGKAVVIYWSWDDEADQARWGRIGEPLR